MVDLSKTHRKIEDIPSDGGKVVDTIARLLLRIFVRLNDVDKAMARLGRRLTALEGPQPPATKPSSATTETGSAAPEPALATRSNDTQLNGRPTRSERRTEIWSHRKDLEGWAS